MDLGVDVSVAWIRRKESCMGRCGASRLHTFDQ
jgi:hypothetical protein